ncbi:MAG: sigma-54-dependent Fis family transcriptional regulator [Candidatus Latescibacteria bacterium]|jgi:two-component system, NtrC family, response regulator AtoC|nr:sigma-54-dependent Fis family transcriptional regulator [Candidatus Latescibacterota bacterium]
MLAEAVEKDIRLLLVDDEEVIRRSAGDFLSDMGYVVQCTDSAENGLEVFEQERIDIVITDIKMPGMDGIEFLQELRRRSQDIEVIIITGHGDVNIAIEALRYGAFDYFTKPIKVDELLLSLKRTRRYQDVRRERDRIQLQLDTLLQSGNAGRGNHEIIGESRAIKEVMALIEKVAYSDQTTVLIQGESGSGKELVARSIHARSPRADMPFISVNSTAIPEALVESELFGHEKGAFTDARNLRKGVFELADGGTLFLDEIGDMGLPAQAKILRVLEERCVRRVGGTEEIPVNVRLISATNQDLEGQIEARTFRQDLYFRLNVFTILLPPLRDRGDDILLLAYRFLKLYASELRKDITRIDTDAQALLKSYSFLGNVRELRNIMERAVILCDGAFLSRWDFPDRLSQKEVHRDVTSATTLNLAEIEEQAICQALRCHGGKQVDAARDLGIGQDALRRRIKKYAIEAGEVV